MSIAIHYAGVDLPLVFIESVKEMAQRMRRPNSQAFRLEQKRRSRRGGATLRPGKETPFWNALRKELRPHLRTYGSQANLGRLLGMPRQRINAFVTGGGRMPDAERTLQLLVWFLAVRSGRPPS